MELSYIELTHTEILNLINNSSLIPGRYYNITDFKTCYDQPDYDIYGVPITTGNYKVGNTHSLVVLATSTYSLSTAAFQPDFPKDIIKYDVS